MRILIILFILNIFSTCFGQTKTDNWFKLKSNTVKGYLHYIIEEDSLSVYTTFEAKFKVDNTLLYYKAQLNNKKDSFLTVKSFTLEGTTDDIHTQNKFKLTGIVNSDKKHSKWKVRTNKRSREFETKQQTIVDWNLFHFLTLLNYSEKGKIIKFNSMEISELNYKENHYLEYLEDETLFIDGKEILTRKITHNGEGIGESTYWLNFENKLIKISIDNKKNYFRCDKKDINFKEFN